MLRLLMLAPVLELHRLGYTERNGAAARHLAVPRDFHAADADPALQQAAHERITQGRTLGRNLQLKNDRAQANAAQAALQLQPK
jgi:hypothetical protein